MMVLVFDLDDTLYPEHTYVASGFRAVAAWLEQRFGWDQSASTSLMNEVLKREGRGHVFDRLLANHGVLAKSLVRDCVRVYRHHHPSITLFPTAADLLGRIVAPLYLVTDGHKVAQQKKVEALGIGPRFRKVFFTHRYGLDRAKPSAYCFELIKTMERCSWEEIAYIADDPSKDFVSLTPLGVATVRVRTGRHRNVEAPAGFEASRVIAGLDELPRVLGVTLSPTAKPA